MAITKKILVELGLDDKQAEAVLKKFREEAEKPVNAKINLDDINQAMGVLRNFFKELKQGLGGNANFSKLSSSIIEVEKSLKSVINTTSKISAIKVEPVGLDSTKEKINEISEGINKLNKEKPDTRFFANIESHLKEIYTLVNSIVAGMQFDKIRPSQIVEKELAATEKALKTFNDPGLTKESIEQRFAIASGENPKDKIQKLASDLGKGNKGVDTISNKTQISNFKTLISYMKDYIRLEGDLNNVKAGSMKTSLGDVYNNIVKDMNLADNPEIKQQIQELKQLVEMRKNLPKLQEELQLAQSRENRSVKATFDPGDMEQFAAAMTRASAAAAEFNKNNTEKNILGSFSEEQFTGMLNALQAINGEIKQINESLKFLDTSKLQAEINEGINKTPIKINVEPELTDPAGFVSEVEKQLAGHKVKLGIDLTDVQNESGEAAEKVSLSDLSGTIGDIQRNASAAAEAVERITRQTSKGEDASFEDFQKLSDVLGELKTSLDNINVEKLNSLSDIFTKLSGNNKLDERIESICNSLILLKETLDNPSGASGFIQELNTLASQGEALKDLATVLKASKKQIEKAKDVTIKKPDKKKAEKSIDVAQTRKRLESALDGKSIEGLGKFSQSDIKKNGSAVLTFVDELEGKVVTTKVKVLDLNEALDKVASNKLSTKDYEILNQKSRDKKQQQTPVEEVVTIKDDEMAKINNGFSSIRNGANTSSEAIGELNKILAEQSSILAKVSSAANETAQSEKKYAEAVKEVTTASAKGLVGDFNKDYKRLEGKSAGKIPEYSTQLEGMKNLINQLEAITSAEEFDIFAPGTLEKITGITSQIKTLNDELKQTKKYTPASDSKITGLQKQMATWESKNSKALSDANVRKQFDALFASLKNGIPESEFDRIQAGFNKIVSSASKAGKTGKTFFEGWKSRMTSLAQYLTTFASFYDVINVLRQGIQVIRDLDTAFVEMQKVSNDSLSSLKEFAQESFALGDSVGTTGQQMQKSAADWMRLGESLNQAKESAKTSNILLNVSEFDNIDSATESLVSMSQAYKDLDKIDIVDKLNNIGNNYSISTDGLATALQKSASALTTAGNDMDEAIALVTAGNQIAQNPDSVGAGIRTIALRIQGTEEAKEQLETLGEDTEDYVVQTTSKIDESVRNFTAVASNNFKGISLLDSNGNYRSTYEILQDIADIYKEIQETDKKYGTNHEQGLLELIAGKNRSNIAASILQNGDVLRSVYESSQNSEGSAQEELDKYLDSVEGKITQLQNHLQEFAYSAINTDMFKGLIDGANSLLKIIISISDNFGAFTTLLGTASGIFLSKAGFGEMPSNAPLYKVA